MRLFINELFTKEFNDINFEINEDNIKVYKSDRNIMNIPLMVPKGLELSGMVSLIKYFITAYSTPDCDVDWTLLKNNGLKITIGEHSLTLGDDLVLLQ